MAAYDEVADPYLALDKTVSVGSNAAEKCDFWDGEDYLVPELHELSSTLEPQRDQPGSAGRVERALIVVVLVAHALGCGLGDELFQLLADEGHLRGDLELDVVGAAAPARGDRDVGVDLAGRSDDVDVTLAGLLVACVSPLAAFDDRVGRAE